MGSIENDLIGRHIDASEGAAEARLLLGPSVWALIAYFKGGAKRNPDVLAGAYGIPLEAVEAALAYYHRHKAAIDGRIAVNVA